MAPEFSFGLGYPVFNFYAPASYWFTSIFSLAGFDPLTDRSEFLTSISATLFPGITGEIGLDSNLDRYALKLEWLRKGRKKNWV